MTRSPRSTSNFANPRSSERCDCARTGAPRRAPFCVPGIGTARYFPESKVAGQERCHEEATHTAPDRPNPTDPGDAADLSIPEGYQRDEAKTSQMGSRRPVPKGNNSTRPKG